MKGMKMITIFGETIRRHGFWVFDALSGGEVKKYLLDMEKKMQREFDAPSDDLEKLLNHAVNTTEFYGKFKGYSSIKDFPIITKKLVNEKYNQFFSSEYKNKPLHKVMTSGSTGERFTMQQDSHKRKRVITELIYFLEKSGFKLGYRHVYAKVWFSGNQQAKLTRLAHNMIMFDCSVLSENSLHRLYQILQKGNYVKCLTGYATCLEAIALYFDKKGYTPDMFDMEIIVSGAERLEHRAKALLKKVFGCTVVSRYANNENGFLAQQPIDDDYFILNNAHYCFETLQLDADEPAPYGERARLVVTDIYNHATPLIRYDTGDIVIAGLSGNDGAKEMILTELSGRKDEIIYDTRENKINPHFVSLTFRRFDRLPQFQFIQESLKNFTVKLENVRGVYDDEDIKKTVKELVGADANVKIEHVDKIPLLSSGKLKKIICNYKVAPKEVHL